MTLVEKMARAIREKVPFGYGMTDDESRDYALAALKAMREPSEGMVATGLDVIEDRTTGTIFGDASLACFTAMIDAAIKEAEGE